jgi:hypothetical protein
MVNVIYFPTFIVTDDRCQRMVNRKIVWKCNHLLELLQNPNILLNEQEYTPKSSDGFVAIGGWEFNVSSTIYGNATLDEVINGWNMFNNDMGRDVINRLFQPFFYRTVVEANSLPVYKLRNQEPELIELLRLSYWYNKCSSLIATNNTFFSKRKEIRGKLTRGLLSNIEEYKTTVPDEELIDDIKEFGKKLEAGLINAKKGKPQDDNFKKYMKEIPKAVWGVTSELIFTGLAIDHGYKVYFDIPGKGHDYDFIVNDIPCQVKTILLEEKDSEQDVRKIDNRISLLRIGKKIEEEEVRKEILDLLHKNKEDTKKAIEQGGRIICINGTQTYAGFLLNQWASDNNKNLTIHRALKTSINLLREENSMSLLKKEEKFLPLIFGAAGIDCEYHFSTCSFKIPIDFTLDDSKLTLIDRI